MEKRLFILLIIFLTASCSNEDDSSTVRNYLNGVVDIMQANSINRNSIDWRDFRDQVLMTADGITEIEGTNGALRIALGLLGDNHSLIRRNSGVVLSASNLRCQLGSTMESVLPDSIGYIRIGPFSGTDNNRMTMFAQNLHDQIQVQDNANISGWIVDLRGNTGGNMWPMLAGVGPILGEGIAGYFIGPNGSQQFWDYSNGGSRLNQSILVQVPNPYTVISSDTKVAVLLDQSVISSGEAIAVAFIGRPNTRSFGSSTCGLSTSNSTFVLPDGSILFLTTAFFADRNRTLYGGPLAPDVVTDENNILERASEYLLN